MLLFQWFRSSLLAEKPAENNGIVARTEFLLSVSFRKKRKRKVENVVDEFNGDGNLGTEKHFQRNAGGRKGNARWEIWVKNSCAKWEACGFSTICRSVD